MTTSWTLITDGTVVNVAVAGDPVDANWIAAMEAEFDAVIDVTTLDPRPAISWTYDPWTGEFTPPPAPEPDPPAPEP